MSVVLIFLSYLTVLLVAGGGQSLEEAKRRGDETREKKDVMLIYAVSLLAVLLAYGAGYWAPH